MNTSTHRTQTVHIDEQTRCATTSVQWLLENKDEDGCRRHPVTVHNEILMRICGEEAFATLADDLEKAQSSVDLVCWGFDPGMELKRTGGEWPRGETYGGLLKRLATREKNPVKVRLLIWYSLLGGQKQKHMPGYTDALVFNQTSDERAASFAALEGVPLLQSASQKSRATARADHCVEWWRWALNKKNAHQIEVLMRDGDPDANRGSLAGEERTRPSWAAGSHLSLANEKTLLEQHGTHHQKTVLIDYRHAEGSEAVGYVMGLNSMTAYWDTRAHKFNDPLREYDTHGKCETTLRVKKAGGKVDAVRLDPYQDYACRLKGECLAFINANFASAWIRAGRQASLDVPPGLKKAKFSGQGSRVQVIRTQPEEGDKTIRSAYFHALEWARDYVYVENQYFQYEEWVAHMKAKRKTYREWMQRCGRKGPDSAGILHAFIVIPRPEIAEMAPRTYDTLKSLGRSDQMHDEDIDGNDTGQFLEMQKEKDRMAQWERDRVAIRKAVDEGRMPPGARPFLPKPERSVVGKDADKIKEPTVQELEEMGLKVLIGMLVSYDDGSSGLGKRGHADSYRQVYIHSKLLMVDDSFFTVGSANLNQRSMAADSEINISTDDPVKARTLRKEVWALHTGGEHDGGDGTPQQIAKTFERWQELMRVNDEAKGKGQRLQGFLCTFRDCKFSYVRYA